MQDKEEPVSPGAEALEAFFSQFGSLDTHAQIVLEEFFRELLDEGQE
jgi:hypothetical protein